MIEEGRCGQQDTKKKNRMQKGREKMEKGPLSRPAVCWLMMMRTAMGRNRHVSEGKEGEQEKQEDADESKVAKICASTQLCGRKKLNEQKMLLNRRRKNKPGPNKPPYYTEVKKHRLESEFNNQPWGNTTVWPTYVRPSLLRTSVFIIQTVLIWAVKFLIKVH